MEALADLKDQVRELLQKLLRGAALWQLLIVALAAGIGEEVLFRGLIQAGLAALLPNSFALVGSLLIASVLFGLCHYLSNTYFALATLAGAYFGLLMLVSGSLLPAIIAHALYDFIALAYLLHDGEA
ncbi:CPBP family intramembrane glutamic endopeptidase [Anatilimnocola floriformis]|uniref:CPBP family intramembrane glutamic endopeptidase n=1 Tax=Anatilimnocola floriformis TaxID=2948575 RepID=UPI0020C24B1A|nr:CPBP family intramembrane glutamic endopeptidase [Anatilimnocola floriformis]